MLALARLKRDTKGISNVIVIVLSLVIILTLVSNTVLWNYEMNQLDWEKMRETIEIQLRYNASDSDEKWHLKAYNWTSLTYINNGFNTTTGHALTTTVLGYYSINLTDKFQDYLHPNGTILMKFHDESLDTKQTTINIDFLGVRVVLDGARFTFENKGSLTAHLVSLWVNNLTLHRRYDLNLFINSAETLSYFRPDLNLPSGQYTVKIVTERGNTAVYSGN